MDGAAMIYGGFGRKNASEAANLKNINSLAAREL